MKPKGAQYSKVFRKAGIAWGKGDVQKAIDLLAQGLALARQRGDLDVARILQRDIERYQRLVSGEEIDLSS